MIIKKNNELPSGLQYLTGKDFNPDNIGEVLFIQDVYNLKNLAKIPYFITSFLTLLTATFFIYTLINEMSKSGKFRNEGVIITFIIFAFTLILFLLSAKYFNRTKELQQDIASGEKRFGLWITQEYLISNDTNEGFRAVNKKEIDHIDIYKSGRPRLDMVIVHLKNKQVIRIAADWLTGYFRKPEELKTLIENHIS